MSIVIHKNAVSIILSCIQIFPTSEKFFISTKELSPLLFITKIISRVRSKLKSCLPCSEKFFISTTELSCYFTYIYITKGYLPCLSKTKELSLLLFITKSYLPCSSKTKELCLFKGLSPMFIQN